MENIKDEIKNFKVTDPLYFGGIWDKSCVDIKECDNVQQQFKEYRFFKKNKAKKYHKYECHFFNNTLELMILPHGVYFNAYGTDEKKDFVNKSWLFFNPFYSYEEIDWLIKTMDKIHAFYNSNGKDHIYISKYKNYIERKSYINGAVDFTCDYGEVEEKYAGFWDNPNGGYIYLADGLKEDIEEQIYGIEMQYSNKPMYFPMKIFGIPVDLLRLIKKDIEEINKI